MPCYQLRDKCLFCDAYLYDEQTRKPSTKKPDLIPAPHILDQSVDPPDCLMLNDAAAFIARFIVLGVDTALIPQIVQSEYRGAGGNAVKEVQDVEALLTPYLEYRTFQRPYQPPQVEKPKKYQRPDGKKGYDLDFSVNWFGVGGVLKGPV
jgi:hypothetical protein